MGGSGARAAHSIASSPALQRWRSLPAGLSREEWFAVLEATVREHYLVDPENPYRQSGRTSGAERWVETRRCIADAVHRSGDFMDVGCANGLLLETLAGWCAERGHVLRPHGIDLVAELIELARARHPGHADSFEVANALYWKPRRTYEFVRVSVELVPEGDRHELLRRMVDLAVAPGGRLIACHYVNAGEQLVDVGSLLGDVGCSVAGVGGAPGVALAWADRLAPT